MAIPSPRYQATKEEIHEDIISMNSDNFFQMEAFHSHRNSHYTNNINFTPNYSQFDLHKIIKPMPITSLSEMTPLEGTFRQTIHPNQEIIGSTRMASNQNGGIVVESMNQLNLIVARSLPQQQVGGAASRKPSNSSNVTDQPLVQRPRESFCLKRNDVSSGKLSVREKPPTGDISSQRQLAAAGMGSPVGSYDDALQCGSPKKNFHSLFVQTQQLTTSRYGTVSQPAIPSKEINRPDRKPLRSEGELQLEFQQTNPLPYMGNNSPFQTKRSRLFVFDHNPQASSVAKYVSAGSSPTKIQPQQVKTEPSQRLSSVRSPLKKQHIEQATELQLRQQFAEIKAQQQPLVSGTVLEKVVEDTEKEQSTRRRMSLSQIDFEYFMNLEKEFENRQPGNARHNLGQKAIPVEMAHFNEHKLKQLRQAAGINDSSNTGMLSQSIQPDPSSVLNELDVSRLLDKLVEFDRLKRILLNANQLALFEYISHSPLTHFEESFKPPISRHETGSNLDGTRTSESSLHSQSTIINGWRAMQMIDNQNLKTDIDKRLMDSINENVLCLINSSNLEEENTHHNHQQNDLSPTSQANIRITPIMPEVDQQAMDIDDEDLINYQTRDRGGKANALQQQQKRIQRRPSDSSCSNQFVADENNLQ